MDDACHVCTCCFISEDGKGCPNEATHEIWMIDGPPESTLACMDHITDLMPDDCCIWKHHNHGLDRSHRMVRAVLEKRWENLPLDRAGGIFGQTKRRYLNGELTLAEGLCELVNHFAKLQLNLKA